MNNVSRATQWRARAPTYPRVGTVLAAVKDASRRWWPSAILDRGCARRQRNFRSGQGNGPQPNKKRTAGLTPPPELENHIDRAGILLRPKRKIPIWLGGFSSAAYERAARLVDGFRFSGQSQTEAVAIKANIQARLAELGGANDEFGFESIQQYGRGDNQRPGDIAAWRASGGSHISVVAIGASLTTVGGHIDAIRRLRDFYNSGR